VPGVKRSTARISGARLATVAAATVGAEVRTSRKRRGLSQAALATQVGISRPRLSDIEGGRGASVPLEIWLALAHALGRFLRFEFARDPLSELIDAGHLDIQELVLRVAKPAGWERAAEALSRPYGTDRSVDVRLTNRRLHRLAIVECWNTFGDLGASSRSSDRKRRDAEEQAVAVGGERGPYQVGLCWVVRDTKANRAVVARYEHFLESRFPGSSVQWLEALAEGGAMPQEPGLVWCDNRTTRLFAHRRRS
jgi:transcriptional regulator with XRE-family HTH domain